MTVMPAHHPDTQQGFTLLELLVVVGLIGLFALVIVSQTAFTDDSRLLRQQQSKLADTVTLLHERSLFSGDLTGLILRHDGWTPVIYNRFDQVFFPLMERQLQVVDLPESLELTWTFEDDENEQDADLMSAAKAMLEEGAQTRMEDELAAAREQGLRDDEIELDPLNMPDLFFFPSGETTPVTLTIRSRDRSDLEISMQLNALGRVYLNEDEQP